MPQALARLLPSTALADGVLQEVTHQLIDAGVPVDCKLARLAEELVIDRERQICHGTSVARNPCRTGRPG